MRKNQQGNTGRGSDRKGKDPVTTPVTTKSEPQNVRDPNEAMLGFGQVADATNLSHLLANAGSDNHHLTPHHVSHIGNSQSLATLGLPSPMGLGAAGVGLAGSQKMPSNQMSFCRIESGDSGGYLGGQNAGSSAGRAQKQIEQVGKELEMCATQADADNMQEVLASNADIIPKKTLNVALRAAVKGCTTALLEYSIQCTELLIDAGANINSEEANEGKTALMMACEKGYLELVKNLLDHDALIDHKDQKKRTPLMYAIGTNAQNFDVVEELLNRGADVNEQTLTGLTPLLLATKKEHTTIVKLLLSRGALISAQFPEDLNSSLHYSCIRGNITAMKALLQHCTDHLSDQVTQEFLYLYNKQAKTALDLAIELHEKEGENEAYQQIYEELGNLYSAKQKKIDDDLQTLIKEEEASQIAAAAAQQLLIASAAESQSHSRRHQSRAKDNRKMSNEDLSQKLDEDDFDAPDVLADLIQSTKFRKQSVGKSKKKVKKGSQHSSSIRSDPFTDEDNYLSAESKTPPKDTTSPHNEKREDDDTVTEHSSDEEQFEKARNSLKASDIIQAAPSTPTITLTKAQKKQQQKLLQEQANAAKSAQKKTEKKQGQQQQNQQQQQQNAKSQATNTKTQGKKGKAGSAQESLNSSATRVNESSGKTKGTNRYQGNSIDGATKRQQAQNIFTSNLDDSADDKSTTERVGSNKREAETNLPPWMLPQSKQQLQTAQSQGGAVQKPIINQQSWPEVFIQKAALSPHSNSSSSKQKKQNAAVVENIKQNSKDYYMDNNNTEHSATSQQQQSPGQQREQSNIKTPFSTDNQDGSDMNSQNSYRMPQMQQNAQQASAPRINNNHMVGAASATNSNHPPPIQLFKSLDSRKAQFDFILEQQEIRNKMLTFQLYNHKERIREIDVETKQRKANHIIRVNEYYDQANRYYENFRQLENEMNNIADQNDSTLTQSFKLLEKLQGKVQDKEAAKLISQLQNKLETMEQTNQKFTDEMDFRKEDEKSFIKNQEDQRKEDEKDLVQHMNLQNEMAGTTGIGASKQTVASIQTQYNNLLVDMEHAYGEEGDQTMFNQQSCYPQQVFNKLHDEIILFDESVKSIMEEMEPIKTVIIEKIASFIKQVIPNGDVEVYGSHATKLCLHWSDVDLVLKPVAKEGRNDNQVFNMTNTRNWLNILYHELIKSENRGWLQKVDFIENTTVPVIKLACSFQHMSQNANGQLLLPNGNVPRYPAIVSKPINIDITLWSENHNGPPCVKLVKSYLQESQLIEPLILVLKQMLKVWGFNDAYTGGLSSYALFLMIVSFLQEKNKPALKSEVNLGETLLEFIHYYSQLDFSTYAICCKMPGEQSDKQNLYQNTNSEYNFFLQPRIVIDDPLMASNNVGKSAFRFQEIKSIMCHAYNSVFTGCFCSCHFKSLCHNTNYSLNNQTFNKSQLLSNNSNPSLPSAPLNYLQFQHPPQPYDPSAYTNQAMPFSPQDVQNSKIGEFDATAAASSNNRAPYPAGQQNVMGPPLLKTQSQPFQIGRANKKQDQQTDNQPEPNMTWSGNGEIEHQCTCDSILSRIIYGYNNYRRTMESLHPNLPAIQMGQSFNNSQPVIGAGFGLAAHLNGIPFIGGQNM